MIVPVPRRLKPGPDGYIACSAALCQGRGCLVIVTASTQMPLCRPWTVDPQAGHILSGAAAYHLYFPTPHTVMTSLL